MMASIVVASLPASAWSQFPIDAAATGDTNLVQVLPARPFASFPSGNELFVPYSGTRMLRLDADGAILSDAALSSVPLSTLATGIGSNGVLMVGKTASQHAFIGLVDGTGSAFDWIDSLFLPYETYYSGVSELSNSDLLLCGTAYFSSTDLRPIVRRMTSAGAELWMHDAITGQITRATHGRELSNGDLIVTGLNGPPFAAAIKLLCRKYSSGGALIASVDFGTGGFQQGLEVMEAADGGSIIWGRQDSPMNLIVAKVDDDCAVGWSHYYAGYEFQDACPDPAGQGYWATGRHPNGGALVARFDNAGDTLWTRRYGSQMTRGTHIRPDGFGGFFISGWSEDAVPSNEPVPYFLRIDADGSMTAFPENTPAQPPFFIRSLPGTAAWSVTPTIQLRAPIAWHLFDSVGRELDSGTAHGPDGSTIVVPKSAAGALILRIMDAEERSFVLRLASQ